MKILLKEIQLFKMNNIDEKQPFGAAVLSVVTANELNNNSLSKFIVCLFEDGTPDFPSGTTEDFDGTVKDPRIRFLLMALNKHRIRTHKSIDSSITTFVDQYLQKLGIPKNVIIKRLHTGDFTIQDEGDSKPLGHYLNDQLPMGAAVCETLGIYNQMLGPISSVVTGFLFLLLKDGTPDYPRGLTKDYKGNVEDPRVKLIRNSLVEYKKQHGLIQMPIHKFVSLYCVCLEIPSVQV